MAAGSWEVKEVRAWRHGGRRATQELLPITFHLTIGDLLPIFLLRLSAIASALSVEASAIAASSSMT